MKASEARVFDTDTPAWRVRHASVLLGCCASLASRVLAVVVAVLFGSLGALALATAGESERLSVTLFLCGLALAGLWGLWFSRLLVLHVDARQARMPGVGMAIGGTLALASLATVVLPALLLAIGGVRPGLAVCALAVAACAGVLMATLPRIVYMLLCFAPLVLSLLHALFERLPWTAGLAIAWRPQLDHLGWLLPPLLLLTGWRWFAIVRQAGRPAPSVWWQPAIMAVPGGGGTGWFSGGAFNAHLPDWLWPAGQTAGAGPARPVRAIRALIGTPFAPLSAGQLVVQLGIGALAVVYLLVTGMEDGGAGAMVGGIIGGSAVLVGMYGQRLDTVYHKRTAETDELALLPGFGGAHAQRGTLLRAVAYAPGWAMVAMFALLVMMGALTGIAPRLLALVLMAALGLALMTTLACLRPLAGLRMDGGRMLLIAGPVLLLAMVTIPYAVHAQGTGMAPLVFALLWLLVYAAVGSALVATWRRFAARPHPFLQD